MMLKTLAAAALLLLAGSAQAEPQKAVKAAAPEKAAPPCPKIDFTVADVVRKRKRSSLCVESSIAKLGHLLPGASR